MNTKLKRQSIAAVLLLCAAAILAVGYNLFNKKTINEAAGKNRNDKKISVIIPVYNAEKYISECLDSIIGQTNGNLEIICVNDGSSDNSLNILNEYKKKDARIVIIDKKNGGVSSARNIGIKNSTGEYITFVDADDYLDLDAYEKCLNKIEEKNADVLFYGCIMEPSGYIIPLEEDTFTDPFYVLENKCTNCTVWNKIFKRSLIIDNNVLFAEDVSYGEDDLFLKMALPNSKVITVLPDVYYHYVSQEGSAENTYSNEKRLKSAINRCKHFIKYYTENEYKDSYLWVLRSCIDITYDRIKELDENAKKSEYSREVLNTLDSELIPKISEIPKDINLILQDMRNYIII